jgi:predicted O-methyltransferase YrrM
MDAPFPEGMLEDIQRFFVTEATRAPGLDLYLDVFKTDLFFPLQRQAELAEMMRTARLIEPRVVYEIGCDKGSGLYHWCKCLPTVRRVVACEIRGTPYCHEFEKAFPNIDFLWLEESSFGGSAMRKVSRWLAGDKIDCLFIDGHKRHFETDFNCYRRMMNPAGVVFMHDITDEMPGAAYQNVIRRGEFRTKEIIDRSDTFQAIEREGQGIPIANVHERWLRTWRGRSCGVGVIHLGGKS